MLMYPNLNPVAFHIGSWPVYWYGLMYLIGFLGGWSLLSLRLRITPRGFTQDQLSDIIFYTALAAIIGGRIGYMIFYDWQDAITSPLLIFQTWKGGMSFHGGVLGVVLAFAFCARKQKKSFLEIADLICPVIPFGLGAGRIGNFINGELWGRVTDSAWGMVFPLVDSQPRHPSQLYELALEGLVLFTLLWFFSRKPRPLGAVSGLFALCYGMFRCFVECFREPDANIGYIAFGWLTEGQLLSIPLIFAGIALLYFAYARQRKVFETK